MKPVKKPFYVTSSNHISIDGDGNKILHKAAKINGSPVILKFVLRSDQDIQKSRHRAYKLLVP